MSENRLTGLDFMRVLACMLVLFCHLFQKLDVNAAKGAWKTAHYVFTTGGPSGVGIFFMLSGFLLAHPFWRAYDRNEPLPNLREYAIRRASRIVPGYYVALSVSFVLSVTIFAFPLTGELWLRLLSGFLFVSEFHPVTLFPVEVNQPLWSIGMEVFSYALLPFAFALVFASRARFGGWRGRALLLAIVVLAIAVHWLIKTYVPVIEEGRGWDKGAIGGAKSWMPLFNPVGFFVFFVLGSLAAGVSTLWTRPRNFVADLLAIGGLVFALYQLWPRGLQATPEAYGWFDLPYYFPSFQLGIGLALLSLPHSRILGTLLDNPPIRFLARISFGIYIWHMLAIELVRQYVNIRYRYGGVQLVEIWIVLSEIVIVLTLAAAMLSWRFIEKPALDWGRKLTASPAAPRVDNAASAVAAGQ